MTGEQRMEEGRRMFQIFAARMFEQRVLTAYREKVAQERQKKLLEELEEESRLDVQREQKKAKEAQKKKDKRRQQKQAKDEERARKEGEKAAEEAAARAVEEQKTEELRLKKEELRRKKEAERKAQEDERLRKEAEKHKKLQEERERQAEQERKHREQKERERKKREEAKREREEYEAREREFKERKAREEKERKAKDAKIRAEREARERARKQEMLAAARQAVAPAPPLVTTKSNKRPAHPAPPPPPVAPALASPPKALPSPHPPIATPAIPKAPSSARPAQAAHPESGQSSPPTPQALSRKGPSVSPSNVSRRSSPGPVGAPPRKASLPPVLLHHAPAAMTSALPSVPISVAPSVVPGVPPSVASVLGVPAMTQAGMPIVPGSISNGTIAAQQSPTRPTFHFGPLGNEGAGHGPPLPPIGSQLRTLPPVAIAPSPSLMGPPASAGRGLFIDSTLGLASDRGRQLPVGAAVGLGTGLPRDTMPTHTHSRHQSASMDEPSTAMFPLTQPIARPNPIQRPASAARQRAEENIRPLQSAVDDLSNHLGSSALMGDNDESFPPDGGFNRRASAVPVSQAAPGPPPPRSRYSFASMYQPGNQVKVDPIGPTTAVGAGHHPWGLPQMPFGVPSMARTSTWSQSPNVGWSSGNNAFGIIGSPIGRPSLSRPVNVRLMIVQACKELTASNQAGAGQHPQHHSHPHLHRPEGDLHDVNVVLSHVEQIQPMIEAPVTMKELLEMCETEGDGQNGGGYFTLTTDPATGYTFVRHEAGGTVSRSARGSVAPPGDIGSPVPGSSMPMTSFGGGGGGGGGGGVIGSGSGGGGGGGGSVVGVGPLGPLPSSIVSPSVGF
ncbi:MAG: Stress response protein nst1 [Phylliscum demangeonii]|nr:MAG: Stress response protein nst1 [Phylliscum demangeonii]